MKRIVKDLFRALGYELTNKSRFDGDVLRDPDFRGIWDRCRPFTMTSSARMFALYSAIEHISHHRIPGDFVECGVWRGGSSMAAALSFLRAGESKRDLFLFDTFEGMPKPAAEDRDHLGVLATQRWQRSKRSDHNEWAYAPIDEVRANLGSTGYPEDRIHMVKGMVEDTVPARAPDVISLLRLDTDWYASTKHELEHLYPRVSEGGFVMIDDYGHWAGSRKATDEYLARQGLAPFLVRIDYSGRLFRKRAGFQ